MIINNNIVKADQGKYLKTKYDILQELTLGEYQTLINGEIITRENKLEDITEVIPVRINNEIYYVSDISNYNKLVTELIRLKYTLDEELAIAANARVGNNKDEEEFQNWRSICKSVAKNYVNE